MTGLKKVLTSHSHREKRREENKKTLDNFNSYSGTTEGYVEEDPSVAEWLKSALPTGRGVVDYLVSLFPFSQWIFSYNLQWLIGDLIAGKI